MRDIKRIKKICKLLKTKWEKVPDQRLGQFLANYVFGHHVDVFFQEDDVSQEVLEFEDCDFFGDGRHER